MASAEDALDHRRLLACTLRTAVFILRQSVADLEQQISEFALWTLGVFGRFLVGGDYCVSFCGAPPRVRTAAVGVVGRNAAIFHAIRLEKLDLTADLVASRVLGNRLFRVEAAYTQAPVTFVVLRLHALAFFVCFALEVASRQFG